MSKMAGRTRSSGLRSPFFAMRLNSTVPSRLLTPAPTGIPIALPRYARPTSSNCHSYTSLNVVGSVMHSVYKATYPTAGRYATQNTSLVHTMPNGSTIFLQTLFPFPFPSPLTLSAKLFVSRWSSFIFLSNNTPSCVSHKHHAPKNVMLALAIARELNIHRQPQAVVARLPNTGPSAGPSMYANVTSA